MEIPSLKNPKVTYDVGESIGGTEEFRLYECMVPEQGPCILKIATNVSHNGLLDREAYILAEMRKEATELEEEYSKIKKDEKKFLNYHFMFPDIIESFVSEEQEGRRVNILGFSAIAEELPDLIPLSHIVSRDRARVDPRTSAWILGKLLKLLVFTHSQNILIGSIVDENIVINREQHYVAIADWTAATTLPGQISLESVSAEIAAVTREVVVVLGGNPEDGAIPKDLQLENDRYQEFLKDLLGGKFDDAQKAHGEFYKLIRELWPRGFHKYRTYSI